MSEKRETDARRTATPVGHKGPPLGQEVSPPKTQPEAQPEQTEPQPQPQPEDQHQPQHQQSDNEKEFTKLVQHNPNLPQSATLTTPPNPSLAWFSATTPDKQSKLYFFTPSDSGGPPNYVPYEQALALLDPIANSPGPAKDNHDQNVASALLNRIYQQRPDLTPQSQHTNPSESELNPNDHRQAIEARKQRQTAQQSAPAIPADEFARKSPPPRPSASGPQPATKLVTPQTAPNPNP